MIINIIKNPGFFESLKCHNEKIMNFASNFSYNIDGQEYDFSVKRISQWFNPKNVRNLGLSRTYPDMCSVQYRPEYSLIIHCSNYMPLFLMKELYSERKDVLFEDIGAGLGWLYVYLNAIGFLNFHTIDNFSQVLREGCELFSSTFNLNVKFNVLNSRPIISNNVACPLCPVRDINETIENNSFYCGHVVKNIHPELELIINATNPVMVNYMRNNAERLGFKFLCNDSDDLSFVYCRVDKFEEFHEKLVSYESI